MWTFDNPPLKQWKERYNFEPPAGWLDKVRLSTVRLNDGGTASFVSPNGLIITNQHVANGQLSKMSSKEKDYVKEKKGVAFSISINGKNFFPKTDKLKDKLMKRKEI